jgi:predicted TIM-barrel fold metal-dependent hydrolase
MLATALGFPLTYMVTVARLIMSGVFDRFPSLRIDAISTWPNTVAPIKAMSGLSEADKEKILGGNAMRLFGIKTIAQQ